MCMILSPNCCTVTILDYSSTDVTLLPNCLSVLREHVASQSKWQSADLDILKLAKKRKSVCSALFRGNLYIWFEKISNVSAILGLKSTARLKVSQNTRSPPLSENLKFRKRMGFSVLGSLITVPLHSTLAVNRAKNFCSSAHPRRVLCYIQRVDLQIKALVPRDEWSLPKEKNVLFY